MKKVGIMGGTFNPVHFGHLFLAEQAYEQLALDKVLFMPSKNPPHKAKPESVSEQGRVDMIELAIRENPHFELSTVELEREGMTYTADTLTILTEQHADTEYFFIVGADSLFMMQNWWKPETIFKLCTVAAANRDNMDQAGIERQAEYLKLTFGASIALINMPMIQISSAEIRKRISAEKSVRYYLPDSVYDYIRKNRLYAVNSEDTE